MKHNDNNDNNSNQNCYTEDKNCIDPNMKREIYIGLHVSNVIFSRIGCFMKDGRIRIWLNEMKKNI